MKTSASTLHDASSVAVTRRRVYYLSGFDPRGAAFYHRMYRDEAGKQAVLSGAEFSVGPRRRESGRVSCWQVTAGWNGQQVETEYLFLGWDDIVRAHWLPQRRQVLAAGAYSLFRYVTHGAFAAVRRAGRGPFFSALFPYVSVALLGVLSGLVGMLAAWLVAAQSGSWPLTLVAGLLALLVTAFAGLRLAEQGGVFWLLRIYVFACLWGQKPIDTLEARMDAMAERILQDSRQQPVDEVLVIGHSVGTMLAVSVAARLLRMAPQGLPAHRLVTLGGCIPLLSLIPSAVAFRRDLAVVGEAKRLPWVDVAAVADPLCFAGSHPLTVSGVAAPCQGQPRLVTARFFRLFSAARYRVLRRNKLRLHFQYLMAGEVAGEYDYFRLTAGPDSVKET
ncbi:hypothetical protein [Vogesella indigofera]|uniref:hypothetical protein n=1 Tax=Vogesella indigofera TaxID=45465 RepID=UPI0035B25E34